MRIARTGYPKRDDNLILASQRYFAEWIKRWVRIWGWKSVRNAIARNDKIKQAKRKQEASAIVACSADVNIRQ